MRYLENDRVKVGIDLRVGGAVTFLTDRDNGGENMINSFDWGRQIQLSFYSGPKPYIGPNGEQPVPHWAALGWNPIQSGDAGGNGSKVTHFAHEGHNAMRVRCLPMQWPLTSGVAGDCEFDCLYTLEGNVLTLRATIFVNRPDTTQYEACLQEMPALYTNGAWYKYVAYIGDKPFQNEPITVLVDRQDGRGWPCREFAATERWSALLDDHGKGIGVYQPDALTMRGGFHGGDACKGHGSATSNQTGYIGPTARQILDHNITWGYETAFVLGTVEEIREYARRRESRRGAPAWTFTDSRHGWFYGGGARDTGWPIRGGLEITHPAGGKLIGPETFLPVTADSILEIEAAFDAAAAPGAPDAAPDAPHDDATVTVVVQPFGPSDMTDWLAWSTAEHSMEAERLARANTFPTAPAHNIPLTVRRDGTSRVHRVGLGEVAKDYTAVKQLSLTFNTPGAARVKRIELK